MFDPINLNLDADDALADHVPPERLLQGKYLTDGNYSDEMTLAFVQSGELLAESLVEWAAQPSSLIALIESLNHLLDYMSATETTDTFSILTVSALIDSLSTQAGVTR